MAKELPYFRFTPQEWQNGDVSLESYEIKGFFMDVCSYYWIKDCSITLAMLNKKFSNDKKLIKNLIDLVIIDWNDESDYIQINFLNEQFDLLSEKRKKRQKAGRVGGLKKSSNAKAMLKQNSSYKDKDKDKDNYNKKELQFKKDVYALKYPKETLEAFFDYWSEPNKSKTKMKFEQEKTWDLSRRLKRWSNNDFSKTPKNDSPKIVIDR